MGYPANLMTPARDKWGQYRMPDGSLVNVQDVTEQYYYDSEMLPVVITAGQEFIMCRNPNFSTTALKVFGADYNMPEWGRVPLDWYYSIQQVGFHFQIGIPFADLRDIVNNAYVEFRTGSQKTETDGLMIFYPIGVGLGGAVAIDGNAGATEVSALNLGSPAGASIIPRKYTIELPAQTNFDLRLRFPYGTALSAVTQIFFDMKVVRFRPVT